MSENKINWNFILSLKDLNQFLNRSDLLVNSLTSKYIRNKLRPNVFKSININEIIELIPEEVAYEGSFDEKYKALDYEFCTIQDFVQSIQLDLSTDPFFVPAIVDYFGLVTKLLISEAIIPEPIIKIIFSSLKHIKVLKLNYTLILFHPLSNDIEEIHLPTGLISLDLTQSGGVSTQEYENVQTFMNNESDDESDARTVDIRFNTNFPNLRYLRFMKGNGQEQIVLQSFFLPNSQIEFIDIFIDQLTTDVYTCLAGCSKLKSVVIFPASEVYQLLEFNHYPSLPSVEKLNLFELIDYSENILNYITAPIVNIKHLVISNMGQWKYSLHKVIQNYEKLEKLTVYCVKGYETLEDFVLTSKTLKYIEFKGFDNLRLNFEIFNNCPNVTRVRFDTYNYLPNNLKDFISELLLNRDWEIIEFSSSINCYKKP